MAAPAPSKPRWLIAGGMGTIGRNLVKYLIDNNLVSEIRVVDKRMPFMAFLNPDHKAAIENPIVEVVQADVSDDEYLERVFAESASGGSWDVVVNAAFETAHGKKEDFYAKGVDAAAKLAQGALRIGAKKYIFVSTAQVYKPSAKPSKERGDALGPYTQQAEFMLRAEAAVQAVAGLPWVIVRPAVCYGPGDVSGVMPRCVVAAAYIKMGAKMEFMWDGDLKVNTVHVFDVVRALYFLARKAEAGSVWNLADKGNTNQARLAAAVGRACGVETGFVGSIKSNLAALALDKVVDAANEQHLAPWLALLREHKVAHTPLSPFLHRQLLAHNHLCVDGSAIEETLGFKYLVPELTPEGLAEVLQQHVAQGIFPPVIPGLEGTGGGAASRPA